MQSKPLPSLLTILHCDGWFPTYPPGQGSKHTLSDEDIIMEHQNQGLTHAFTFTRKPRRSKTFPAGTERMVDGSGEGWPKDWGNKRWPLQQTDSSSAWNNLVRIRIHEELATEPSHYGFSTQFRVPAAISLRKKCYMKLKAYTWEYQGPEDT